MLAMHFERRILAMSGESTELATDGFGPLVQYDISFQKRTPLLGTPSLTLGDETSRGKETSAGIHETLGDEVNWDPSVDKADRLDYLVAAASGVISGLIDTLWVGEFSLDRASSWGEDKVERFVIRVARSEGYNGDDLAGAIRKLEKNHPFAADGNANAFGGGLQHHLRDFSHHFGIDGLFFSIFTQFTGLVVGTDLSGALRVVPVPESYRSFIGKNLQEKLTFGTIGWFFHMVSDMAGSGGSLMGGTGIPGPIVSLIKDVSALPLFRGAAAEEPGLRLWVSKLFNGTLLADHDENGRIVKGTARKFDLRTEIGMLEEVGRQALPVLVNQCVVRGFYFCRRAAREIRDLDIHGVADLGRIAPEDILPWGTPAMRRMVTVSSGIFVGVDIADAAVRSIASRRPVKFFLRVNYVGIATFTVMRGRRSRHARERVFDLRRGPGRDIRARSRGPRMSQAGLHAGPNSPLDRACDSGLRHSCGEASEACSSEEGMARGVEQAGRRCGEPCLGSGRWILLPRRCAIRENRIAPR